MIKYRVGSLIELAETGELLEICKIGGKPKIAEMRNVNGSDDEKHYSAQPWEGTARLNKYIRDGLVKVVSY
jgi:hypothetical protein